MKENKISFLNKKAVKTFCKERGKRVGRNFMSSLEYTVERYLEAACETHNGTKVTLDETVAGYIGLKVRIDVKIGDNDDTEISEQECSEDSD